MLQPFTIRASKINTGFSGWLPLNIRPIDASPSHADARQCHFIFIPACRVLNNYCSHPSNLCCPPPSASSKYIPRDLRHMQNLRPSVGPAWPFQPECGGLSWESPRPPVACAFRCPLARRAHVPLRPFLSPVFSPPRRRRTIESGLPGHRRGSRAARGRIWSGPADPLPDRTPRQRQPSTLGRPRTTGHRHR